jgi:hypothetical protein
MPSLDDPLDGVLSLLEKVTKRGNGYTALCPAHDDLRPSLSIQQGDDGHVLLFCHAGCEPKDIVAAIGLNMTDLFPPKSATIARNGHGRRIVATYDYRDEAGQLLYQGVRFDPKDFQQRRPDGKGGWVWNLGDVRRVPYRLSELLAAAPWEPVLIVEGEKDADRLAALGFVVTTNAGGAGKWRPEYSEFFRHRPVVLLPDNDEPGEKHTTQIAQSLQEIAASVQILRLPDLPQKGDVSDWLDAGSTREELDRLIAEAPVWEPPDAAESAHDVPVFPLDALPPAVHAFVAAASKSLSVPVELVAVPLLGLLAATVGNRLHLILKHSWREYLTLYLAIVAPPGSAKTPSLSLAKWPLDALQKQAHDDYRETMAEYDEKLDAWKGVGKQAGEEKPKQPQLRHYFSTDLTVEALAGILANAPGVAIICDEIAGWVAAMDQYKGGKGSDRQQYLSLWSSQTLKVDRKGGGSVYVPNPVVCVVGGIQPDLVATLHDAANRRDGFVERILPVVPVVGPALWTDAAPTTEQYREVLAVFEILDQTLARLSAQIGTDPTQPTGIGVHLSPEAKELWVSWVDENARITTESAGLAAGFYAKLPAHVARFALILHALWLPNDPRPMLSAERMADAIELGEFFRAHIGRFLALLQAATPARTAGTETRIMRILRNANQDGDDSWVPRTTIYRGLRNVTADELTTALDGLVEVGEIEQRVVASKTKPVEEYRIRTSHNSQNPNPHGTVAVSEAADGENSANSAKSEPDGDDDEWAGGEEGTL